MQIAAFRIRPTPESGLYYTVRVFDGVTSMRAYAKAHARGAVFGRFVGLARTWTKLQRVAKGFRTTGDAGEMLLEKSHLGAGVVSHECAHLAIAWARRLKLTPMTGSGKGVIPIDHDEERFCYALGYLVRSTYVALRKLELI